MTVIHRPVQWHRPYKANPWFCLTTIPKPEPRFKCCHELYRTVLDSGKYLTNLIFFTISDPSPASYLTYPIHQLTSPPPIFLDYLVVTLNAVSSPLIDQFRWLSIIHCGSFSGPAARRERKIQNWQSNCNTNQGGKRNKLTYSTPWLQYYLTVPPRLEKWYTSSTTKWSLGSNVAIPLHV